MDQVLRDYGDNTNKSTYKKFGVTFGKHATYSHIVKKMALNGKMVNLHLCMDHKKHMVPCSFIHVGTKYSVNLVNKILEEFPRFVHKHTLVYKMYMVMKLFYLHQ